ncbi:hypothetical protein [Trichormus sp. NMC-1]|uniref:hypothetical protein n=1 Tax=Trichormus sp. NMC-1 TaxID=1853259 RepID=UPI0008DC0EFB|nr:hypothetical protein [Trichormus sp. NMC-1]
MTKLLNTVATRIQTRLSRKGVKVALGVIKDRLTEVVSDIEKITDVEVNQVTEHFISNATQLTVIGEDLEPELEPTTTKQEIFTSEVDTSIQPVYNHQDDIYTTGIDNIEGNNSYPITADQDTEESALTTATKPELVSTTAQSMGIVLDVGEISLIAENVGQSTDSLDQDIDAIKSAIMAFVKHKAAISQQKINNMISEVREVVSTNNTQNSQQLTDGLRQINSDIQEGNKQFKSNVRTALKAFAIPAIKAG